MPENDLFAVILSMWIQSNVKYAYPILKNVFLCHWVFIFRKVRKSLRNKCQAMLPRYFNKISSAKKSLENPEKTFTSEFIFILSVTIFFGEPEAASAGVM